MWLTGFSGYNKWVALKDQMDNGRLINSRNITQECQQHVIQDPFDPLLHCLSGYTRASVLMLRGMGLKTLNAANAAALDNDLMSTGAFRRAPCYM